MPIKVLIRRKIPEAMGTDLQLLFVEMRALAVQQQGYIGGETLKRVDTRDEFLVISRWQNIEDWGRWLVSNERRNLQERIDTFSSVVSSHNLLNLLVVKKSE